MNAMKKQTIPVLAVAIFCLCLGTSVVQAQQPAAPTSPDKSKPAKSDSGPVEAGDNHGDYTIISTLEFGYRGQRVDGDLNKYRSDLNYKAGPRLFDSSFLMKALDGKGGLFDTFLVTTTGWGADPHGQVRVSVENPKWYRFDGIYRKFKYF